MLKNTSNHYRYIATLIGLIFPSILLHAQLPVKELLFKSHSFNHTLAFSSDNKFLVTNGKGWICPTDTFDIKVWDVDQETIVNTFIGHKCNISSVTFSPDNKLVISASTDGYVKWWNLKTNTLEKSLALKEKIISAVFTSQGKYLVLLSVKEVPVPNKSNSFIIQLERS
jgi:WD40 repeat protein